MLVSDRVIMMQNSSCNDDNLMVGVFRYGIDRKSNWRSDKTFNKDSAPNLIGHGCACKTNCSNFRYTYVIRFKSNNCMGRMTIVDLYDY